MFSFQHIPAAATDTVAAFPPGQADLALATFLLKILIPGSFVRDRPDRASPRKTKKAGDFPARKPGEPSPASPSESSSTCSIHGRSPKSNAIELRASGAL